MLKIFTSAALICSLLIACNNNGQSINGSGSGGESNSEQEKKITKRDYTITRENAYNDIFLDSTSLEKFIANKKLPDSLSRRMRSFYNARNYQFAWFTSNGLTEQGLTFWNIHSYETTTGDTSLMDKTLEAKMKTLMADSSFPVSASDRSMVNTEFLLTEHFIKHTLGAYEKGYVKRKEMERFIPTKKENPIRLADSLLNKKHKDDKYFEDVNNAYKLLKVELNKYVDIEKRGGWQTITADAKKLKYRISSPAVVALKRRLQLTAYMPLNDTSQVFDDTLSMGIKQAQQSFGYKPDGILTASLIKDLNVPVEKRIEQILINMNRMRWMPQEPEGKLILVNIPEFVLHFVDGKNKVFDMNVVVGKEGHNTMMFTGKLSTIVFSPYWNVPPSIVKKEILPHMASNPNYLEQQQMEVTGNAGGLPVVRQLPGEKNSLGKVKFLFPNSYDIYFHDTPAKSLFNQDKRAYSHGCIRLSDPLKMAEYLLRDNSEWPEEKIIEAMNSGNEKFVKVKEPIPVFITYYTAWVDENGLLNFRDDIYKRDAVVSQKMFASR
jgi:murein L,D-transpeptidase YcbB/YkuD